MKNSVAKYIMKKFETESCDRIFHITFSYKTKKGNRKQQVVAIKQGSKTMAENFFWVWINIMKEDNPKYVMKEPDIISLIEVL